MFPEYRYLHSYVSLLTLQAFPTSEKILDTGEETIAKKMKELCKSRSQKWADSQAEKLMAAAAKKTFQKNLYHSLILNLDVYINMLLNTKSIYPSYRCFSKRY